MGIFSGITELALSPIKLTSKTATKLFDEEWETEDALTLGITKLFEASEEEIDEIIDAFDDD